MSGVHANITKQKQLELELDRHRQHLEELVKDLGITDSRPLSDALALLLEGATVTAQAGRRAFSGWPPQASAAARQRTGRRRLPPAKIE